MARHGLEALPAIERAGATLALLARGEARPGQLATSKPWPPAMRAHRFPGDRGRGARLSATGRQSTTASPGATIRTVVSGARIFDASA